MKFKDSKGMRILKHTDDYGDRLQVDHFNDVTATGNFYLSVNEKICVILTRKKARKLAEAILAELDR